MWAILLAAVNTGLGFIFRTVIVKFVLFFGLFFVVHEFVPVLASWLPDAASLTAAFGAQSPHGRYVNAVICVDHSIHYSPHSLDWIRSTLWLLMPTPV